SRSIPFKRRKIPTGYHTWMTSGKTPSAKRPKDLSEEKQERPSRRAQKDDRPGRHFPNHQQGESHQRQTEIPRSPNRFGPQGIIKGRRQYSHHRRMDPVQGPLKLRSRADPVPKGECPDNQQKGGKKDGHRRQQRSRPPADQHPQVGGKGEEGPRHGLSRPVPGEKLVGSHPPGRHHFRLQERKNHVASAKHQRTRPVKAVQNRRPSARGDFAPQRKKKEQPEKQPPGDPRGPPGKRNPQRRGFPAGTFGQKDPTEHPRGGDDQHLTQRRLPKHRDDGRQNGDRPPEAIRSQPPGHAPNSPGDHRHRDDQQSVNPTRPFDLDSLQGASKRHQRQGGRQ